MLKDLKQFSLPEIEEKVLKFWRTSADIRGLIHGETRKPRFVFYEGPPTANGRPGLHHVLARAFKDVVLRYKTMRGYSVPRRAGWDTHGLPVEIEVEKALGLKSKKEIEEYGVAEFNLKCKESVWKYRDEWEKLTERIGFWLDMDEPYVTYENSYIESVWGILGKVFQKKLLYKGHRIVPWCTRCGTALSSHELAQGYEEVKDTSVYIKFRLKINDERRGVVVIGNKEYASPVYVLSWTTTPWTLPGNVALAVGRDISYSVRTDNATNETFIFASDSPIGKEMGFQNKVYGNDLVGLEYEPLFPVDALRNEKSYKVYAADFVTTKEGTGVVHTAVMYGEDDYALGDAVGLPKHHTVDEQGRFTKDAHELQGMYVRAKETEKEIINHLETEGYLLKTEEHTHDYPFCWRCGTALLYYAHDSWFIKMSELRKELIRANKGINWIPEYLKEGRFGEWLREVKDWAISRSRYWGTPLPVWECSECGVKKTLESREEISRALGDAKNEYYLMRHEEAECNVLNIVNCKLENSEKYPLTLKGRVAVEKAAKSLTIKRIDMIFSSPFHRAKETAEVLGKALGIKLYYDVRLSEVHLGDADGKAAQGGRVRSLSEFRASRGRQYPGAESLSDVTKRMFGFVSEMEEKYKGKRIVIVSHGDPLWMLEGAMRGMSEDETIRSGYWGFEGGEKSYIRTGEARNVKLVSLPRGKDGFCDLHRPYIDEVRFPCAKKGCKGEMRRVPEVVDVWFDSGSMPWASQVQSEKREVKNYPADYICEAIDQTRGWFYTLLAIGVLLKKGAPYKNVLSVGHVLDTQGQKMSKSKGNVVSPWDMVEKYGADVVRWYFYTVNPAGEPKRFDEGDLQKVSRRFFHLVYNSFVFHNTYAKKEVPITHYQLLITHVLDRWILARLEEAKDLVMKDMDAYEMGRAARRLEEFAVDLSRWYIRRSRARFQKPESGEDYAAASGTLGRVLLELSKLLGPFIPFFAEALYQSLAVGQPEIGSVHLESWPEAGKKFADKELVHSMEETRRLAAEVLSKRAEVGIKIRQPLAALKIRNPKSEIRNNSELLEVLKDEVNVKEVLFDESITEDVLLDTEISHTLWEEGVLRELQRTIQGLRQDAKLRPRDEIALGIDGAEEILSIVKRNEGALREAVGAKRVEYTRFRYDAELETKIEGQSVRIGLRKV